MANKSAKSESKPKPKVRFYSIFRLVDNFNYFSIFNVLSLSDYVFLL